MSKTTFLFCLIWGNEGQNYVTLLILGIRGTRAKYEVRG